jgi:DNA-binding protein YbaB
MAPDLEEKLRSLEARAGDQRQRALRLSAELESAEVTVQSPDGAVTVRVNSAGGLTDPRFHPAAGRLSRDALAALVLTTSRQAQARLADRVGELVSGLYGPGPSTAAFVTDAYTSRYPAPDDETRER